MRCRVQWINVWVLHLCPTKYRPLPREWLHVHRDLHSTHELGWVDHCLRICIWHVFFVWVFSLHRFSAFDIAATQLWKFSVKVLGRTRSWLSLLNFVSPCHFCRILTLA